MFAPANFGKAIMIPLYKHIPGLRRLSRSVPPRIIFYLTRTQTMDQMKIVISEAGEKVAGAASDASKKLATLTGEKTKAFPVEAAPSESPAPI